MRKEEGARDMEAGRRGGVGGNMGCSIAQNF